MSRIRPQSKSEFFGKNAGTYSYEDFAEKVYLMIHTYYLSKDTKIKPEMGKTWKEAFGVFMTDEAFEYMLVNAPIMLRDVIIDDIRHGGEVSILKYLKKSLVAFEFDLWIVENNREGNDLKLADYHAFLHEKYGDTLEDRYDSFLEYDLRSIASYKNLATKLDPYYEDISDIFSMLVENNHAKIEFENEHTTRVKKKKNKDEGPENKKVAQPTKEEVVKKGKQETTTPKEKRPGQDESTSTVIKPDEIKKLKETIKADLEREYHFVLIEKDERIEALERDIREFKRQRDEAREYSVNQYDRGVKDLFNSINDVRYGKVIDYLFALLENNLADENLSSYLDNMFMALEDMEIEPMEHVGDLNIDQATLVKNYNLAFDKAKFDASHVALRYFGWKYKDIILEKPTLELKEEE